ncbi:3-hydroxyacyl-CoA dehydrogenase family protein [Micromonospora sp. NBS 11-29]|uniref:3-hydroxyacyl-CoA dehydrogenase family protein n=1 Tax=Micromonospora sp. NBS 11-29 TaxID=1960879 RepID=UPI000B78D306|nr:3-hydroxyacyl-CoA dehydrogenase family protein [Micromonospora sp. NBS 11-29]
MGRRVPVNGDRRPPTVAVVGAGTLGVSVAHACLVAGSPVTLLVRGGPEVAAEKARWVGRSLARDVGRRVLAAADARAAATRLRVTADPGDLSGVDVALECVAEDVAAKRSVIAMVESVVDRRCLIASTTSSIPAGTLAVGARHPARVLVTHYIWPAHRMPLVEVAWHARADADARDRLAWLCASQRKSWVRTADRPGFLITRALLAYWDAAIRLVDAGVAPDVVDGELEAFGWPIGPLRIIDAAGMGSAARVHGWLSPQLGRDHPGLARLSELVDAGRTGFYRRDGGVRRPDEATVELLRARDRRDTGPDGPPVLPYVMDALADAVADAVADGVLPSWEEAAGVFDAAFGYAGPAGGVRRWPALRPSDRRPVLSRREQSCRW